MKEMWLHGGANALENQGHLSSGAAAEETAETGAAGGLCRCSCNKCQESSSFSSRPTRRHWHSQNCIRFWVCDESLMLPGELFPHPCRQRLHLDGQESTGWEWAMGASPVGTVGQGRGQGVPGAGQTWAWGLTGTGLGSSPRGEGQRRLKKHDMGEKQHFSQLCRRKQSVKNRQRIFLGIK